jgi:drug/metabolite transporter (DMT)-like permease
MNLHSTKRDPDAGCSSGRGPPAERPGGAVATLAAASFAVVAWGLTPAATKLAVGEIDALTVGILRTVLAMAPGLPLALALRLPLPTGGGDWRLLAISAVCGFVGFPLLFGIGVNLTTTAHAALIMAALPIFTGLFGAVVARRRPDRPWWRGAALALAGEVVLVGARFGFEEPGASLEGDFLTLASCIVAAAGYVAGSRLSPRIGTWSTTFWGLSLGGMVLLPLLVIRLDATDWDAVTVVGWNAAGYLALFSTVLAYVCWYWALARGGTTRIGSIQFAQPVVALGAAVTAMGEVMTVPLAVATVAILAGIAIAQRN